MSSHAHQTIRLTVSPSKMARTENYQRNLTRKNENKYNEV